MRLAEKLNVFLTRNHAQQKTGRPLTTCPL
jgi:hypothetical protein